MEFLEQITQWLIDTHIPLITIKIFNLMAIMNRIGEFKLKKLVHNNGC